MKKVVLVSLCITIMLACQNKEQNKEAIVETKAGEFDWLLGNWKRVNDTDGKETFENWEVKDDGSYQGKSFTMFASDTVWQEDMHLLKIQDTWQMEVKAPEDLSPTVFGMINHLSDQFTCENPELDFPKTIYYKSVQDSLYATVSNKEMQLIFTFEKLK